MSKMLKMLVPQVAVMLVCLIFPMAGQAAIVTQELVSPTGVDSGWSVTFDDAVVDITADIVYFDPVDPLHSFLGLEISKDFTLPYNQYTQRFPAIILDFVQTADDALTVGQIRILEESITNDTNHGWLDFHWEVMDHNEVWFDVDESGDFGIMTGTFQHQWWQTRPGDPHRADGLTAFDGSVQIGESYYPGTDDGDLVIRINLEGPGHTSFTFKEYPTKDGVPEPATMALLGLGLLGLVARRRVRK